MLVWMLKIDSENDVGSRAMLSYHSYHLVLILMLMFSLHACWLVLQQRMVLLSHVTSYSK